MNTIQPIKEVYTIDSLETDPDPTILFLKLVDGTGVSLRKTRGTWERTGQHFWFVFGAHARYLLTREQFLTIAFFELL